MRNKPLVLSTELIMKIDHRTEILKADVLSVSPSSERIEELCVVCSFYGGVEATLLVGKTTCKGLLGKDKIDKNDRIPFTLTFHPHNHAVKSIILNNLLQNDPETGRIFP